MLIRRRVPPSRPIRREVPRGWWLRLGLRRLAPRRRRLGRGLLRPGLLGRGLPRRGLLRRGLLRRGVPRRRRLRRAPGRGRRSRPGDRREQRLRRRGRRPGRRELLLRAAERAERAVAPEAETARVAERTRRRRPAARADPAVAHRTPIRSAVLPAPALLAEAGRAADPCAADVAEVGVRRFVACLAPRHVIPPPCFDLTLPLGPISRRICVFRGSQLAFQYTRA
jgi:hypothetical protein